ncbi:phage tail protein [Methylocaldum marinum]|uniref:Phage tail protein n=1 Tax=Methylocaldum marinum TaxID=1432792 RepID=A0A250KWZ9_9GAMM|nr:phage tail protein [Methylocaldum marinum]BBA36193.1 phage tail protein [Methylocaldum marinum]
MAQFTKNSRVNPYKNFKFLLFFEGRQDPVAGISKVSPLKRTTEVVSHRDGGDLSTPRHSPGASKFEPITFERGVTHDPDFEEWANLVYSTEGDAAVSLAGYKRNLLLKVLNLQGVPVKAYRIFRCWVSEYTSLPELDANANATMIETIVVQNEGHERDPDVVEPVET